MVSTRCCDTRTRPYNHKYTTKVFLCSETFVRNCCKRDAWPWPSERVHHGAWGCVINLNFCTFLTLMKGPHMGSALGHHGNYCCRMMTLTTLRGGILQLVRAWTFLWQSCTRFTPGNQAFNNVKATLLHEVLGMCTHARDDALALLASQGCET